MSGKQVDSALLKIHGITGIAPGIIDNIAAYIRGWISKLESDDRLVITAASKAEKAAKYIQGAV